MSSGDSVPIDPSIADRLAELERDSDRRRAELRSLIDELPATVSRRSLLTAAARDLRHAPNKREIVRRGLRKVLRAPAALVRRVTSRS